MTGKPLDPEEVIRAWLADSLPNRAPASLKETLDDATSEPAGHARPWSRSGGNRFRLAGRIAAAVAISAIVASGVYLYSNGRATSPGQGTGGPSVLPTTTSAPSTTGASPSPSSTVSQVRITQLPGSNWRLVTGALPAPDLTYGSYGQQLFALTSGGFAALWPMPSGDTRFFLSADGISWDELAELPPSGATVTDITESGATIVAVGQVQGKGPVSNSATAWTTSRGHSWQAIALSPQDGSSADHVAVGPSGFMASGSGPDGIRLWASRDGIGWHSVVPSGISADEAPGKTAQVNMPVLLGDATGYVLAQLFAPRVWQSTDGTKWTETYHAPPLSGLSNYYMGPIIKAPDGSYRSFGGIYTGTGIADPVLGDTVIWTSPDMAHWTMSGSIKTPGWGGFASITGGFVVAGTQTHSADLSALGPLGVWTSGDGRNWKPLVGLSSLPMSQVLAVAGDGSHVLVAFVDPQGQLELLVGDGLK